MADITNVAAGNRQDTNGERKTDALLSARAVAYHSCSYQDKIQPQVGRQSAWKASRPLIAQATDKDACTDDCEQRYSSAMNHAMALDAKDVSDLKARHGSTFMKAGLQAEAWIAVPTNKMWSYEIGHLYRDQLKTAAQGSEDMYYASLLVFREDCEKFLSAKDGIEKSKEKQDDVADHAKELLIPSQSQEITSQALARAPRNQEPALAAATMEEQLKRTSVGNQCWVDSKQKPPARLPAQVPNLPEEHSVAEYAEDIQDLWYREEVTSLPRPDYMTTQVDITEKMRTILIDWLIEVHMKYRMRAETLFLTVNIVDRYLSHKQVGRKRLQLVGVSSMLIASKFEDINPPEVPDFVYITDHAYTRQEVTSMECCILRTLNFRIVVPTAANFFEILQRANGCDEKHRARAQYILELGLLDTRMLHHKPSHVVAAALLLSNEYSGRTLVWPDKMSLFSRHTEKDLRSCSENLRQLVEADQSGEGGELRAVHKKFSAACYFSVARDFRK
jgi:cyclin B